MARQSFKFFTPRDKPKKRGARQHKKNKNKSEKRQKKQTRYKGQGWHYPKISYIVGMKEKINKKTRAPKSGKDIECPKCKTKAKVYHFAWSALQCMHCKNDVEKGDWYLVWKKKQ